MSLEGVAFSGLKNQSIPIMFDLGVLFSLVIQMLEVNHFKVLFMSLHVFIIMALLVVARI